MGPRVAAQYHFPKRRGRWRAAPDGAEGFSSISLPHKVGKVARSAGWGRAQHHFPTRWGRWRAAPDGAERFSSISLPHKVGKVACSAGWGRELQLNITSPQGGEGGAQRRMGPRGLARYHFPTRWGRWRAAPDG